MTRSQLTTARRLLCALQDYIRDTLIAARAKQAGKFARIAAVTAADTIYHVDRLGEEAILDWLEEHWPKAWPLELVMEGLEHGSTTVPSGTAVAHTKFRLIVDPIDGPRGVMYDKRSAWILAGLAPQRGARTHLGDLVVAAMTEFPTSKHGFADQLSAVRGGGVVADRLDLAQRTRRRWSPRPSRAKHFEHGFASFARFFPEGKSLLGRVEEELWRELGLLGKNGGQLVFDDQYISTGGQFYELMVGHDRMLADLRPPAYAKLGFSAASLCCHPYDVCTALIAQEAGCLVELPDGRPLRVPLDTTTPVTWVGYANPTLARLVRPVLRRLMREYF